MQIRATQTTEASDHKTKSYIDLTMIAFFCCCIVVVDVFLRNSTTYYLSLSFLSKSSPSPTIRLRARDVILDANGD